MGYYAEVINGVVTRVLVVTKKYLTTNALGDPINWIETDRYTKGGVHTNGGTPLRKNFPGVGFTYDKEKDAFIPPPPFASWLLNEETCLWDPPVPYPQDGNSYIWDESQINWKMIE